MPISTELRHPVKVQVVCRSCRHRCELCVPVEVPVPGPLRCSSTGTPASGAGSPGGLKCPRCGCPFDMAEAELRRRVENELQRGRGRHVKVGAVVIDCR